MSLLEFLNIRFVPSVHQRLAFAEEARRAFRENPPEVVALELPPALAPWIARGVMRLPQVSAVCYPAPHSPGEMFYVPIDPADSMIEAARLAIARQIPIEWLDAHPAPLDPQLADLPDDLAVEKIGLAAWTRAVAPYLERLQEAATGQNAPENAERERRRERDMTARLDALRRSGRRVLCVLGAAHFMAVRKMLEAAEKRAEPEPTEPAPPIEGAFLSHVNPESIPDLMREIPFVVHHREMTRDAAEASGERFDKLAALRHLLKIAEEQYGVEYDAQINLAQYKALFQYARNLALTAGRLQPDAYELIVGAKSTVDGDFGYEVYETARAYDSQVEEAELPGMTLRNERGMFTDREEKYRMTPLHGRRETEKIKVRFRRRPPAEMLRHWQEDWLEDMKNWRLSICSWPPEDERQERFMTFLRKRAQRILSEDRRQVVEFTTSLLDGLDVRETMRNWHTGKFYVHQSPPPPGKVEAVVVAFAAPELDGLYPWRTTLYAENQNESDIAFYATPLGEKVVGPRISVTEFGGILSIYPARGIPNVWHVPGVGQMRRCCDVLLAGAIAFSATRHIAYVADRPPSTTMRNLAARHGKHILYMPIKGMPPAQLRKIRNFHILGGRDVRSFAADYIFED